MRFVYQAQRGVFILFQSFTRKGKDRHDRLGCDGSGMRPMSIMIRNNHECNAVEEFRDSTIKKRKRK